MTAVRPDGGSAATTGAVHDPAAAASDQAGRRGRVLVVSHPAVRAVNQQQYAALAALGWDVRLVTPARWRDAYSDGFDAEVLLSAAVDMLRLAVLRAGQPQRHVYRANVASILRRVRPDVVLLEQEPFALSAAQWGLAAARAGIPFVVQAAENLDRHLPLPVRGLRSVVLRRADLVTARSPAAADLVRRWGARGLVEVVPHPVVTWPPAPRAHHDRFTVGYAGRLVEQKGLRDLLGAADRMATPARLLVVGNGPMRDEVAAHPAVELWDHHPHDRMAEAYAQMDVLVLPSRRTPTWEEQFGRVLVEALSCGVPVVGADTGEIPWVVGTTGGGWTFPEGDVDGLAVLLDRVAADPEERAERAAAGGRAVEARFTVGAVARQLDILLAAAVAPHRGATRQVPPEVGAERGAGRPKLTLVVHDLAGGGGMERMHTQTLLRLADRWDVTVVSTTLAAELAGRVRWQQIRVPRRPAPLKFAAFWLSAGWWLRRHPPAGVLHTCGAIVPTRADVVSVHLCHAGVMAATGRRSPDGAPRSRRLNTAVQRTAAAAAERWCYRPGRAGVLHAVSEGLAGELSAHYPGVPVAVVPNGVDTARFRPDPAMRAAMRAEHEVGLGTLVALFVGGDWDHKGLGVAIDGLAGAVAEGVDTVLWVVGTGDRDRFEGLAHDAGVGGRLVFFGRREDPVPYYQAADVLVLPSRYEAYPLVAIEAASCGLPVVAAAVNGAVDLVGADEAGFIVPRDAKHVAAALVRLAGDHDLRSSLGVEARRRAVAMDWSAVADRLHQVLAAGVTVEVPA